MTKRSRRFILLTSVLTFFSTLLFNNIYASDFLVDTTKNIIDTTTVNFSDLYHNGYLSLASLLPFHDHYLTWDTTIIHPYKFDLTKMEDTVMLVLADHKDCAYMMPVAGYVTSNFGPRSRTRYHYGIDLKLDIGDSVVSAFDGIVRISHYSPSYGNCVVVRHYNGLETLYAHLSKRTAKVGESIRAGQLVGYGGNTGRSSGPHLHFEVRYKGQAINPNEVFHFTDSSYHSLRTDTLVITNDDFAYLGKFRRTGGARASHAGQFRSVHVIKRGDTLSKVAVRNGTTINRICQLNRINRNSKLRIGQKLRVR